MPRVKRKGDDKTGRHRGGPAQLARALGVWGARLVLPLISACADLTPPPLPPPLAGDQTTHRSVWLNQTAARRDGARFYHTGQDVQSLRIPYDWFVALEQPDATDVQQTPFSDTNFLERFGFPRASGSQAPAIQPLPPGFTHLPEYRDRLGGGAWMHPASGKPMGGVGLTCAACHSARMTYNGVEVPIDFAPAITNPAAFGRALGLAVDHTNQIPARFDRFAAKLLGDTATDEARARLHDDLRMWSRKGDFDLGSSQIARAGEKPNTFAVEPASGGADTGLWSGSWFNWLRGRDTPVRPTVERAAAANQPVPSAVGTVPSVRRRAALAAGPPPKWPDFLPPIEPVLAARGKGLYGELCQSCHGSPSDPVQTRGAASRVRFDSGTGRTASKAAQPASHQWIGLDIVGTDPEQANAMARREIKLPETSGQSSSTYVTAIAAIVWRWYDPSPAASTSSVSAARNIKAPPHPAGYRARPLNGIWATPPYLHNGSIPTLDDLLSPAEQRPSRFLLGGREYDPVKAGYRSTPSGGGFLIDTKVPGSGNGGHEFRDAPPGNGVIGRGLTDEERAALIEYLKTL